MAAIDDQIAHLEKILNSGVESASIDGTSTRFSVEAIRQRLRELYRQRDGRGQALNIRMSGGYDGY